MANAKKRLKSRSPSSAAAVRNQNAALPDANGAKRSLLQLQNVMDQSLVILDSGLRVQSANPCFYDYFGLTPRLTQGRRLRELTGGRRDDAELEKRLNAALRDGKPFHDFELEVHSKHLGRRFLRLGGVRVPNEGRAAHTLYLTISDITDLRHKETVKVIAERERTQREFIANVSHELRTPVTAIKGYAQTLQQGGLDDKKHRMSFVNTIERNADRLARLIADLLRISSLAERPAPRLRSVRLGAAVRKAVAGVADAAEAGKVSIRASVPARLTVSADEAQIGDVLTVLLENAVKFNRAGGRVTVKARAARRQAVIIVADTGVGIRDGDMPRLFERFYRGRNSRARQGAGLGLSIAQQIVTAHGGRIWAENLKGRGAAFHFTLPLWNGRPPYAPSRP